MQPPNSEVRDETNPISTHPQSVTQTAKLKGGFDSDHQQQSVRTGASFASASQFLTAVSGGLASIVAARTLGEQSFGVYAVLVAAVFILLVTATLGIETGLSYYLARRDWQPGNALRQVQLAALTIGIGLCGALALLFPLLSHSLFRNVNFDIYMIALAGLPFALSWTYSSYVALGVGKPHLYAAAPALQMTLNLLLISALSIPLGIHGAVIALSAAHCLAAIAMFRWLIRRNLYHTSRWFQDTPHDLRRAVKFGIRANVTTALQLLNERGDLLILNAFVARSVLSSYAVAVAVTSVGFLIPRALGAVLVPRVAGLEHTSDQAQSASVVDRSLRHIVTLTLATCGVLIVGLLVAPFVYGNQYSDALWLGLILVPGVALFGVGNVLGATVVGMGKPQYPLFAALLVTPPTIGAYILLVPHFGAIGAATASTVSYSCTAVLTWHFFGRAVGKRSLRSLAPTRAELADYVGLLRQIGRAARGGKKKGT